MHQNDRRLARMSALDEALRRMLRTCPASPVLQSVAERLAARSPAEQVEIPP
jgi:hypothetical protein